mgnify:FL=1
MDCSMTAAWWARADDALVARVAKELGMEQGQRADDLVTLRSIAVEIEREWRMGGLVDTIYFEFAVELLRRRDALDYPTPRKGEAS